MYRTDICTCFRPVRLYPTPRPRALRATRSSLCRGPRLRRGPCGLAASWAWGWPRIIVVDRGFMVDPGYPRAACQVRTPAGAAVHDRGDRQGPRSGHPPSPVRAGHVPETVKPYLIAIKRAGPGAAAPRFCRHDGTSCRQEPAQPSIAPTANPCWEPVFGIRVRAGTGETSGTPHILPAQRPTGGTARMWRSPMHPIHRQARIANIHP